RPVRLQWTWIVSLGVVLAGYAFLDRGFAYVGVPPLYIGELVLFLGLLTVLASGGIAPALRSPVSWLLLAFVGDGLVRTVPYWGIYGMDALRDGVVWAYAAFAVL